MNATLLASVGFVLAIIVLDLAALRFGHDSRSGEREMPIGADPVVRFPPLNGRRAHIRRFPAAAKRHLLGQGPLPARVGMPATQEHSPRSPFRPYVPRDVLCYPRSDLAAVGK